MVGQELPPLGKLQAVEVLVPWDRTELLELQAPEELAFQIH
jgi:hypothetical protein